MNADTGSISRRDALFGLAALAYSLSAAASQSGAGTLDLSSLRTHFKGELIVPGHPLYESARLTNNRAFDHRPLLIARCATTDDVARSLAFARAHSLPLAIRSGGHCQAGRSGSDGVVIDLSKMNRVTIDPKTGCTTCGPGARVYQANRVTVPAGYALPLGICGDVGVAGLTLGGGYGYLLGVAGLACDALIGVDLVLADGTIRHVTENSDPDLMWALRGGGANFGIATQLYFNAYRVGPVVAGTIRFPSAAARDVAAHANDCAAELPDELTMFTSVLTLPDGSKHVSSSVCWSGEPRHGREVIAKHITSMAKPDADHSKVTDIAALVGRGEGTDGLSCCRYGYVAEKLPAKGLDALLDPGKPAPIGKDVTIDALHGAVTRRNGSRGCVSPIRAGIGTGYLVFWDDPKETPNAAQWTVAAWSNVKPYTYGAYVNMLGDESAERVRESYGESYARLSTLKRKYDPDNTFRLNQNIKPA